MWAYIRAITKLGQAVYVIYIDPSDLTISAQFGHTLCIKALASLKGDVNQVAMLASPVAQIYFAHRPS